MAFANFSYTPAHNIDDYILGYVPENTPVDIFRPDPVILNIHTDTLYGLRASVRNFDFRYIDDADDDLATRFHRHAGKFATRHQLESTFEGVVENARVKVLVSPDALEARITCAQGHPGLAARYNGRFVLRSIEPPFQDEKITARDQRLLDTVYKPYVTSFVPPQNFLVGASPV